MVSHLKKTLSKKEAIVTEYNLNDQTVSGMRMKDLPVFSVQYHPEASLAQMMQIIFSKLSMIWFQAKKKSS